MVKIFFDIEVRSHLQVKDCRNDRLKNIDLKQLRIDKNNPIIFICGGEIDFTQSQNTSTRQKFIEYITRVNCKHVDNIQYAESIKDWMVNSTYSDLLTFENDIADISSLIVIFLESPGSIAELGLFVKNDALRKKLLIFQNSKHSDTESFIKLGPLLHIENEFNDRVCHYPFDSVDDSMLEEMHNDMLHCFSGNKSEFFKSEDIGHIYLLSIEIIRVFGTITDKELLSYIKSIGFYIDKNKLDQMLFVLEKFDIITKTKRGRDTFLYTKCKTKRVLFNRKFPADEINLEVANYYKNSRNETRRVNILSNFIKESNSL